MIDVHFSWADDAESGDRLRSSRRRPKETRHLIFRPLCQSQQQQQLAAVSLLQRTSQRLQQSHFFSVEGNTKNDYDV